MKINDSEINKSSEIILSNVSDFDSDINKLNGIIDSINIAWNGSDALKYINAMKNSYIPKLKELSEMIKEYSKTLKNTTSSYKELDEQFSKKIDI